MSEISQLSSDLMQTINRHIEAGLTTEEILGVLTVLGYKVMDASKPVEAVSGGDYEP